MFRSIMKIVLVLAVNLTQQFKSPEVPVLNSNMIKEHPSQKFSTLLLLYSRRHHTYMRPLVESM